MIYLLRTRYSEQGFWAREMGLSRMISRAYIRLDVDVQSIMINTTVNGWHY